MKLNQEQVEFERATKQARRCFALLVLVVLAAGCAQTVVTNSSDPRPMPGEPRGLQPVPESVVADSIALQVAPKPRDTNGNGYPDTVELIAYLFAQNHPYPFYEDGAFIFELYFSGQSDLPDAEPIHVWRIEGDRLKEARAGRNIIGLYYAIELDMLSEGGTDRYPLLSADLTARFEPADGRAPIKRQDIHRLQIGSAIAGRVE